MSRLVRLYPGAWRERYGAEIIDLLRHRPPSLIDRLDIALGALDAHLHPQVNRPDEGLPPQVPDDAGHVTRRLGLGALLGAGLWMTAFAMTMLGPIVYDGDGAYRDSSGAVPFILGAVCLLTGGLGGQLIALPRSALLARVGAGLAAVFLIAWVLQPWLLWLGALMLGGLAALAFGAYRARAWPGRTSASVLVSCLVVAGIIGLGDAFDVDRLTGALLFVVAGAALMPAWLSVGTTLLHRPPSRRVAPWHESGTAAR